MSPIKKSYFINEFKSVSLAMCAIRTHPCIQKPRLWRLQCFTFILMNASCLIFLSNSIFNHDFQSGNHMVTSKNFSILIVCINCNIKYFTMLYKRKSIADLITTMDKDYDMAQELDEQEKNIFKAYTRKGNIISKIWVLVAGTGSGVFPIKAFGLMIYYYCKGDPQLIPMFDLTFPGIIEEHKTTYWGFMGVFALCFVFDCFASLVYIGFEPMIPIFTLHACGQIEILNIKISKVISESRNEKEMNFKFKMINMRLQELYSFINQVQNDFKSLLEFYMKSTTFILPCNAYLLLQEFRLGHTMNIEFICLTVGCIVHFWTPCYYCDLLMESSERLRLAIYSCGWENCRFISVRKTVLIMLTRATRPLSIASIFYYINLNSFTTMCRQAYAFLNLMTAAWE